MNETIDIFNGFYKGKRVLVTGHTGFKGAWLCILLRNLGAYVYGYALEPPTNPSLFKVAGIENLINSHIGDIRDQQALLSHLLIVQPEIVFHLAAQPLVRESYISPVDTYAINVMGTVNLLEACRHTKSVKAIVNVTTDKCYENKEWHWGYRESDPFGGFDPYSNSKGCSELVTAAYRSSYFNPKDYNSHGVAIASARAGNVIGGGDWANDRLIPDFFRAIIQGVKVQIRSPYAIRPWQHVLEPLTGYLTLASKLYTKGTQFAQGWNFGSEDKDAKSVEWIMSTIIDLWGDGATYEVDKKPQPHEANYLKLDCSLAKNELKWYPRWDINQALENTVMWQKAWINGQDMYNYTLMQIEKFYSIENMK